MHKLPRPRTSPVSRSTLSLASALLILGTAACDSALDPLIALLISQPSVEFRAVRGSSVALSQTITVSNTGGGRLGPVTCPDAPTTWLTCTVAQGNRVTFTANPTGLSQSPAPAIVPLTAPGVDDPTSVTVTLIIQEPVIALSPSSLAFTANENASSASPSASVVTITNTGAGNLASLGTINCAPAQAGRASCVVDAGAGTLTVSVNPAGVAPGTYLYPLTVSSPNSSVTQTLAVSLRVIALPRIVLSQRTLLFQAVRGLGGAQSQTVAVTNSGEGSLGTVSCPPNPASWLTCSVSGNTTVTFTANHASVTSTPPPVSVNISATGAANTPQSVTVTLALEQPLLELSRNSVSFTMVEGSGTGTPATEAITVTARTAGGIPVSAGAITCAQVGAMELVVTCTPTAGTNQISLSVSGGENLTTGTYVQAVQVSAANSNVIQTVTVIVSVSPRPQLVLTPSTVVFNVPVGTTAPVTQVVATSNSGGGTLGDISCSASTVLWASCTVSGTDVIVTAFPAGLLASPTPVTFEVVAANAPNDPRPLTVQLNIQHTMALSSTAQVFTWSVAGGGATAPANAVITITNTSGGTLANLGAIGCSGPVRITCAVNQGLGTVTISVNPAGLIPGSYPFAVNVTATSASNSPQVVNVTLNVSP